MFSLGDLPKSIVRMALWIDETSHKRIAGGTYQFVDRPPLHDLSGPEQDHYVPEKSSFTHVVCNRNHRFF